MLSSVRPSQLAGEVLIERSRPTSTASSKLGASLVSTWSWRLAPSREPISAVRVDLRVLCGVAGAARAEQEDPVVVIRPGRSALVLLCVLLLALFAMPIGIGPAHAAATPRADACRADQLRGATVTASAKFEHRGLDYSLLTSTMDVKIPAGWDRASDLLLDTHSPKYRFALRCLLGKVSEKNFHDDEWRLNPLTVGADGKQTTVHYEAVVWVQYVGMHSVGPWQLEARRNQWRIQLNAPPSLSGAKWENVHVHLGGSGAMSASPPPTFGEGGTMLKWQQRKPREVPKVDFRPPAAQQWNAITLTQVEFWETWGLNSASSALPARHDRAPCRGVADQGVGVRGRLPGAHT
jgi:hypothetical protein